jgi:hypothetical protein
MNKKIIIIKTNLGTKKKENKYVIFKTNMKKKTYI